jgi:hypothetical protein
MTKRKRSRTRKPAITTGLAPDRGTKCVSRDCPKETHTAPESLTGIDTDARFAQGERE